MVLSLWGGPVFATSYTAQAPHSDYRTGYSGGCGGGSACHTVNKATFTPQTLDNSRPPNYTNFCLSCHNVTGEAHERSAGWASTNAYVNFTGIDLTVPYGGDSHSWKGLNGNAGTISPGFPAYTGYMPGGAVLCQTCHTGMSKTNEQEVAGASGEWLQAVDQGDHLNYRISGYASTKQYLVQYLKVYRSAVSVSSPASRAKKAYQIYTGFTYNYQNATITFNRAQGSAGSVYIYANIGQPYFRVGGGNTGGAMCTDCHTNRSAASVSHPSGSGARGNHPVGVGYRYAFGSHTTLKPSPGGNAYLEYTAGIGNRVLCTSCHDPHNAANKGGSLLREADASKLCLDCHDQGKVAVHGGGRHQKYSNTSTIPTGCTECHSAHSSNNVYLVRSRVRSPQGAVKGVSFQSFTGSRSFGPDTGFGICEVCHSQTTHHLSANDVSGRGHHRGEDCTLCHSHKNGFEPAGGTSPCYGCHDGGSAAPNIKALMGLGTSFSQLTQGGKTSRHLIAFDNTSSSSCLAMCHTSSHTTGSPNLKTQPELTLCASCHSSEGQTTSQGKSKNVMASFGSALHNYTATVQDEFGKFTYQANCTKCHVPHGSDSYPNVRPAINGKATNGNSQDLCFGCHDSSMSKGAVDIKDLWTANPANPGHIDAAGRPMNCVKCHGPHGTLNEKMINNSLGTGLTRDAICRACHSGGGQSAYNVMTSAAGGYGPNFSAASVHKFGSQVDVQVAIGGRTVDLTCYGCHDPHNTKNARLLRDKIVFSSVSAAGAPSVVSVPPISATVQPHGPTLSYTGGWTSYCATCHTSFIDTGGQSPYRRHPTGVAPGSFYPYTAGMGLKTLPLESGNVSCITCHYAHGSPKPKLQRIQSASTPENRLCIQCHDRTMFLQGGQGSHGGFVENQGRCADCHNMHDDANKRLLVEATESVLCERCHAAGGISQYKVWKALTSLSPYEMYGTGGTFGRYSGLRGGTAASMHQINEEDLPAPGGVTTEHRCGTCHNPHGSPNYRILRTSLNNVTGIRVYARRDAQDKFIGYSSGFVKFCSACHASYKVTNDASGNLIRHPVGVSLLNYTAEYNFYTLPNNTSYKPKVELESGYKIACVSCHYAHGSSQNANLKFPGGRTVNTCKTCHNRNNFNAGTPGAHAGFTDNNGTCSDCHSMHKSPGQKLLNYTTDTGVCVNCHDYAAPQGVSTSPNRSHLVVWKGNVADAPASWLNTAGSFGTYKNNPTNGGDAPSMHGINGGAAIAPGDSATVVHCGTCHNTHGSPNYRLLKTSLNWNSKIVVTGTTDANGNTIAHGSGMSSFCTACHKAYIIVGSAPDYMRHPVDVALTPAELSNYNHFGGGSILPLENLTTVNGVITHGTVTCITCHFAHGSPNEKMKRLTGTGMCQICHAKGLDAANSYQQVINTHGGFSGNGGNCSVCHSMHSAGNRKLLLYAEESQLCYSCHAQDGSGHASFPNAPVVWKGDSPPSPSAWNGTGGSFGASYDPATGGSINSHHLINKTDSQAPGGTTTEHHCGTCHNPHGNDNYRLLRDDVNGHSGISVQVDGSGRYKSGISSFCAACHTAYADSGTGVEGYNRHPVNLALSSKEMANLSTSGSQPRAQVEGGNNVMCLSCHFAHGSPSDSMLRLMSYTSCRNSLCQQCHKKGYNASGQQYSHTHGGFLGNEANCVVCHNMHSKGNKKLLQESKEAKLCENCHSGIAKFRAFQAANPAVKITAPSRFNVFSSIGNSFGNYSVGGGGVKSWHKVDEYNTAPGGLTLQLRCGVCHSPHGEDNFVMIRSTIENVTGIKVFGHLSSTGPFNTYSSGFGKLCSACHTRLNNCGTGNPWTRHPVDFKLQSKQLHNWSTTSITPKVPTESRMRVTCITCHNSHGSKNYRLMRLGGNGMCQQCHNR